MQNPFRPKRDPLTESPGPDDLSREQVLALFRDLDNAALKEHRATAGTDGAGTFRFMCDCGNGYGLEGWYGHIRGVVARARRTTSA